MTASETSLSIETVGSVLTIGLNRPQKRNAMNDGLVLALQAALTDLDEAVGAVVIHGVGDHFSAGLDLSELSERDANRGTAAFADVAPRVRPHSVFGRRLSSRP